ncbi:MAG: DoxX family protein [Gammaproteobacteria bacterium]|nr:DoxX family protein [Gammaproteobacteria bacterium]
MKVQTVCRYVTPVVTLPVKRSGSGNYTEVTVLRVGALGLLLPRLSSFTSLCLGGLMLGAIATHLAHNEWLMFSVASAIAVAAFWRGWSGRDEIRQLITTLRC